MDIKEKVSSFVNEKKQVVQGLMQAGVLKAKDAKEAVAELIGYAKDYPKYRVGLAKSMAEGNSLIAGPREVREVPNPGIYGYTGTSPLTEQVLTDEQMKNTTFGMDVSPIKQTEDLLSEQCREQLLSLVSEVATMMGEREMQQPEVGPGQ